MSASRKCFLIVLCTIMTVLISGCAGTASGKKQSNYNYDTEVNVSDVSNSQADAWVTLRYPAMIEQGAESLFVNAYSSQVIDGKMPPEKIGSQEAERIAKGMIAKSNFYVMSMYKELKEQLPESTVLLSPHIIYLGDDGKLSSKAILQTEVIPSVVKLDFSTYSFPDPEQMMDAPPLTFGNVATPLIVAHGNHWLRPATNGLVLSSTPLISASWSQASRAAQEEFDARLNFRAVEDSRPLDVVSFLNGDASPSLNIPTKSNQSSRNTVNAVENYPLEKIILDGELVENLAVNSTVDPFEKDFATGVGTRIEVALQQVDHDRATISDRQKILASFDPDLAFAFMAHSEDESVRARLQLAEKLIEAERKFLAAQSDKIFEGVYAGDFGNSMRAMIVAEYGNLEERRELARQQNTQTALAVFSMIGSAYAGSQSYDESGYNPSMALASDTLLMTSMMTLESSFATAAESAKVGENFMAQMAPALNEQISVQIQLLEGDEQITAKDYTELRQKTMALYQKHARSMTIDIATDCTYRHPSASVQGRWYGECVNGLATGNGYGVIRDDQSLAVEYIGVAQNGTANGNGAMIVHSPALIGATYYEGQFSNGLPDGTVLVEVPGKEPQVRTFLAGEDKGKGKEETLVRFRYH